MTDADSRAIVPAHPKTEEERRAWGAKMAALRHERGTRVGPLPIKDKFGRYIDRANRTFGIALPEQAEEYVKNLSAVEPEQCPDHHEVLQCPHEGCVRRSVHRAYKHREAQYIFDRLMGRPTQRLEQTVTYRLVAELTQTIVAIFEDVNGISDSEARREAFADACEGLSASYAGVVTQAIETAE